MNKKDENHRLGYMREMWKGDFLFEQYPDAILIVSEGGIIEDANQGLVKMFGFEKSDLIGKSMEVLMPNRFRASHVKIREKHMKKHDGRKIDTGMKFAGQRKNGESFPIDIMLAPMQTNEGKVTVTVIRDITEKRKAEAREKEAKDTLKAVINSVPVAIFVLNLEKNVISWSGEAEKLFGFTAEEVIGKPYKLIPNEDLKKLTDCTNILNKASLGQTIRDIKAKRLRKDGSLVDVSICAAPMFDKDGEIYAAAYSAQDITEQLKAEEKLNNLAYFDQLTNLPNLLRLNNDFFEYIAQNSNTPISITTFELCGITEINNTLGYASGAKIIKKISEQISKLMPENIKLYRVGGVRFCFLVPVCGNPCKIVDILEPIFEQIEQPINIDGQLAHIKANAGISISPIHGNDPQTLFSNTSLALTASKKDPNRNYRLFDQTLKSEAQASRKLDLELREAFENNEFELFYQPQINLAKGELIGAEALLRWRHPERGLIQPLAFIDALAKNTISYEVGKWIMRTAAAQAVIWRKNGFPNFRIGVNLFESQFNSDLIENDVEEILRETGLPHEALEIEITENISHSSDDDIIMPLQRLRDKGVHIAFDDFGTGYASLSYLVKYPLTRIKIDKSFLENIPYSEKDSAIVHSTIVMAHSLGLEVIAEGVETPEHTIFLKSEKCEEAQGYFYSRPMPAVEFFEYSKSTLENENIHCAQDYDKKWVS